AAAWARPCPGGQPQLGEQVSARRARLRAGVEPVDHDQCSPGSLRLVLQLAAELTPATVGDRSGEPAVTDPVGHGQVFDRDRVVPAHEVGAGAMQEVPPGGPDFAVGAGDLLFGFGAVVGAALATGHAPLVAGQVRGPACQVPRVGDAFTVGGDG